MDPKHDRPETATGQAGLPDPKTLTRVQLAAYLRSRSTVPVPWAGACCGISRAASYGAARDGSLKTLKLGARLLVPTRWLEQQLGLSEQPCGCAAEPE